MDSLTVGLVAICCVKFAGESHAAEASLYPAAEEAHITCAIVDAVDRWTRHHSTMIGQSRGVSAAHKEGIKVSVADAGTDSTPHPGKSGHIVRTLSTFSPSDPEKGRRDGQATERSRVVDWEHPANSDFLLVSQFSVTGALYTCRPDLVGFVNPDMSGLVVIELK